MPGARVVRRAKRHVVVETVVPRVGPEQAFDAVSDIGRMREWSPEGRGRAQRPLAAGDVFTGTNRRGRRGWTTTCTVVQLERPGAFAFDVSWAGMPVAEWCYRFTAVPEGVLVSESWTDRRRGVRGLIVKVAGLLASGVWNRSEHNAGTMVQTLDSLSAALAA